MKDEDKTKAQLIAELQALRRQTACTCHNPQSDDPAEQEALKQRGRRAKALLEAIPDLMFRLDHNGVFLDYKAQQSELYAQHEVSIIGKKNRDISPPEFSDLIEQKIKETLAAGQMQIFEYQLELPGHGPVDYEARMVPSGPDEVTTIVRDITESKKIERALRDSEARYRQIFEANQAVKLIVDPANSRIVAANNAACHFYGYDAKTLTSLKITDINILSPEEVKQEMEQAKTTEQLSFNFRHRLASGEIRDVEVYSGPVEISQKTLLYSIIHDVTERKQIEQTLRESEEQFRKLFESTPVGIAFVDINTERLTQVNPAFCKMLGYTEAEMLTKTLADISYPKDVSQNNQLYQQAVEVDQPTYAMEKRYITKTGQVIWANLIVTILHDAQGKPVYRVGIVENITTRKQINESLEESQALLRQVLDLAPYPIFAKDAEGRFLLVNRAGAEFANKTVEDMEGHLEAEWVPNKKVLEQIQAADRQVIKGGKVEIFPEDRFTDAHGRERIMQTAKIPLWHKKDQPPGILGISVDITERKQAEEALLARTRELILLNIAGRAFVSSLEPDRVFSTVLAQVRRIIGIAACSIWLVDPQSDDLVCQETVSPQSKVLHGWRLPPNTGLAGWVVQHGQSLNVGNVRTDPRHFKEIEQQMNLELRSVLSVPLKVKDQVFGVLQLVDKTENRFSPEDLRLAESLGTMAAIAIDNARLYRQTQEDAAAKTLLLQEVNHRVKNNLIAITGMLHIEWRHAQQSPERPLGAEVMGDLINRIKGLATVHQLLSNSNWAPLRLGELTRQIINATLQALPTDRQVVVEMVADEAVVVTPKEAHHLAIVINELATNVVKYAAPAQQKTRITVTISVGPDNKMLCFEFRDDGPGFPAKILQAEGRNVGLYLLENTVRHSLRGKIKLHNDNGAVVTIEFARELNQ